MILASAWMGLYLWAVAAVEPAPPTCDWGQLQAFTPADAKILSREPVEPPQLPYREPIGDANMQIACKVRESDEACRRRASEIAAKQHPGNSTEVSLRGTTIGLKVRLRNARTGKTIEKVFANHQATLDFVESEDEAGHEWTLLEATEALAQTDRQARVTVIGAQILERSCLADETDQRCRSRVEDEIRKANPTAEVHAELRGDPLGYQTEFQIDGQQVNQLFPSHQAVADTMRKHHTQGRRILLVRSELRLDPQTRRAVVQVVPTQARLADDRPWLRLRVRMTGEPSQIIRSLMEQTAKAGIQVMRYEPQPDGAIQVDLRCP
jgi:hypothetical protein